MDLREMERRQQSNSAFEQRKGTHKHLGFAFSQEAGHVPQITRTLTVQAKRRYTMTNFSPMLNMKYKQSDEGQFDTQDDYLKD